MLLAPIKSEDDEWAEHALKSHQILKTKYGLNHGPKETSKQSVENENSTPIFQEQTF